MFPLRKRKLPSSIRVRFPWRRALIPTVLATAFVINAVCHAPPHPPRSATAPASVGPAAIIDWNRYHDKTFTVTRVIDGDTFDIDVPDSGSATTRIRLWGVDTPELAHFGKPVMHFGPEAADFARETLAGRSVHIVLSPKQTRGKFGRLLAYVYLERGGRMFNEMLLEKGYAYADLRFPHHYFDQFAAADRRARRAGVGMWADIALEQMPAWKQRFEKKREEDRKP